MAEGRSTAMPEPDSVAALLGFFLGPVDMTVSKSQHHPLGRNLCCSGMAGEHHLHPPYRVSPFGSGQVHHLRYSSSDAVAPASEGSNLISRRAGASM